MLAVQRTPEMVATVEDAVKKLDVPPLDFELTVYLISTRPQRAISCRRRWPGPRSNCMECSPIRDTSCSIRSSCVATGRDGTGQRSAEGTIKNSTYTFRYNRASVTGWNTRRWSISRT